MAVTLQEKPLHSQIQLPPTFVPHSLPWDLIPLPYPLKKLHFLNIRFTTILKLKGTLDLVKQDCQIISFHRGRHHQRYLLAHHGYRIKKDEPSPFKTHSPPQFPITLPLSSDPVLLLSQRPLCLNPWWTASKSTISLQHDHTEHKGSVSVHLFHQCMEMCI